MVRGVVGVVCSVLWGGAVVALCGGCCVSWVLSGVLGYMVGVV